MTNIKISEKGRAFLKKGSAASRVASALAAQKSQLLTEQGITVQIDERTSMTVRSAGASSNDVISR